MARVSSKWTALVSLLALGWLACAPRTGSIGAIMSKSHVDGRVVVRTVPADMESARAGLAPEDELLFIDGVDVRRMSPEEIHQALIGPLGTTVDLTVMRRTDIVRLRVQRGALK